MCWLPDGYYPDSATRYALDGCTRNTILARGLRLTHVLQQQELAPVRYVGRQAGCGKKTKISAGKGHPGPVS